MKALALRGGDLDVVNGAYRIVTGAARIRQDLALALAEPYGNDQYHPQWGSVLPSYIGQPLDDELELLVRAEVVRVLQQYIAQQAANVATDVLSGSRSRYNFGDIVDRVLSIETEPAHDNLRVMVSLQTRSGGRVRILRTVDI